MKFKWHWHYLWQAPFYLFGWGMIGYIIVDLVKIATGQQLFAITPFLTDLLVLGFAIQKVWPKNLHQRILYLGIFGAILTLITMFTPF